MDYHLSWCSVCSRKCEGDPAALYCGPVCRLSDMLAAGEARLEGFPPGRPRALSAGSASSASTAAPSPEPGIGGPEQAGTDSDDAGWQLQPASGARRTPNFAPYGVAAGPRPPLHARTFSNPP